MSNTNPGWYPDATDPSRLRYWDGNAWTEHTAPSGPPPVSPSGDQPGPDKNWFARHKIVSAVLALVLIGIIAAAVGGGSDNDSDKTAKDDTKSSAAATTDAPEEVVEPAPDEPSEKAESTTKAEPTKKAEPAQPDGALPITDGDWRLDSVQLKDDGLGDFGGIARITYIGEDSDASNLFTVTVLDKAGTVIASLDGSAEGMGPDGTETVTLISTDPWKPGKYTLFDFQNLL